MFTRKFIKKPYSSIRTDGGVEFKGAFDKYCYDNSIMHTVGVRGRHQQQANVESLNRQLSRLFNGYMNSIEVKTGKTYRNWTDVITNVRTDLNKLRKKVLIKDSITALPQEPLNLIKKKITKTKDKKGKITEKITYVDNKPKYKMGDIVYRKLDHVEDAIGNKQPTEKARMGDIRWDRQPRKIEQVFTYDGENTYRYQITGLKNVSYSEWELMPAKEEAELFEVRKILNKKKVGNKYEYLTWYWGELKKEASWQPEAELLKYVPKLIKEYNETPKKK